MVDSRHLCEEERGRPETRRALTAREHPSYLVPRWRRQLRSGVRVGTVGAEVGETFADPTDLSVSVRQGRWLNGWAEF